MSDTQGGGSGRPSAVPRRVAAAGPAEPRHRRPPALTALLAVLAVLSVSVLGVSTTGYALVHHYDGNISRLHDVIAALPGVTKPPPAPHDAQNVLLVGSDSRGDLKAGQGPQGVGKDFVVGQRSDTVILAHLFGGRSNRAELVSFPRDSYVEIPAHPDSGTGRMRPVHRDKLNAAFALGGPRLLTATIEQLSGIRVDHYVQVDFQGFQSMVDKLGGVEVCLSRPARDHFSGIDLPAGRQTINGADALAFVRQRHGLENGDIDRIRRQQQFLGAVIRKVLSAGTLANPLKLNGFLTVATDSLQADETLQVADLRDIALRLRSVDAGGVVFATLPTTDINATRGGQSVVLLDQPKAETLFEGLRRDLPPDAPAPAPASAAPAPLTVAPAAIRVRVHNGAGVRGLGRKAAADLGDLGFTVVGVPDNRGGGASGTVVRHGPDKADSARTLAAAIPGATVELDPRLGPTLDVVIGSSYSGARPVKVTASAAPAPATPGPTGAPRVTTAATDPCAP